MKSVVEGAGELLMRLNIVVFNLSACSVSGECRMGGGWLEWVEYWRSGDDVLA